MKLLNKIIKDQIVQIIEVESKRKEIIVHLFLVLMLKNNNKIDILRFNLLIY